MHKSISRFFALALVIMALSMLVSGPALADAEMTDATPLSGYEVVVSPPQNFSDTGWGGWSCPAGKVVLGGGFVGNHAVAVSAPGTPGSVWLHHTFGANEYGWVVQSAPDGQSDTIKIYAICADAPAGYQVVTSSQLNFAGSGWGGWSCPAGKVVLGGGFKMAVAAAASAPATPGTVWPHYTYGANEYGWVAQVAGAGSGFVYPICADAPDGYEVVKSGVQNFGDGGWSGWSLANGKVVSGGGFQMGNGAVAAQAPATPNSVWPHYTYGNEYGWVVRDNQDGQSNPNSYIYVIYANLLPPPSVTPTGPAEICNPGTVDIQIDDVEGLYGYEFIVEYNKNLVSADGSFVDTWFDQFGNGFPGPAAPVNWQAECDDSAGICRFAYTRGRGDTELATAVPETIANILFTPTLSGPAASFDVEVKDVKLTDKDSFEILGAVGGTLTVDVCGAATVSGQVSLQGRPQPTRPQISGLATLSVFEVKMVGPYGTFTAVPSPVDGTYSVTGVPYLTAGTAYTISADHSVYIKAAKALTVNSATMTGENTTLLGGDANDNDGIGSGDLACVGGQFGTTGGYPYTCSGGATTPDLNDDTVINIQDLSLVGGNYGIVPVPQPW